MGQASSKQKLLRGEVERKRRERLIGFINHELHRDPHTVTPPRKSHPSLMTPSTCPSHTPVSFVSDTDSSGTPAASEAPSFPSSGSDHATTFQTPDYWTSPPGTIGAVRIRVSGELEAALQHLLGVVGGGQDGPAVERVECRALWRSYRNECALLRAMLDGRPPTVLHGSVLRQGLDAALPLHDVLGIGEAYLFCTVPAADIDDVCAHGFDPATRLCAHLAPDVLRSMLQRGNAIIVARVAIGAEQTSPVLPLSTPSRTRCPAEGPSEVPLYGQLPFWEDALITRETCALRERQPVFQRSFGVHLAYPEFIVSGRPSQAAAVPLG